MEPLAAALPLPVSAHGLRVAGGLVAAALAADVVLIRRGHLPVSTAVRQSKAARAIAAGLACHLLFSIPHDPLSSLGRWLEERGKR